MQFIDFFLIWKNLTSNIENWEKLIKLQNYQKLRINLKKKKSTPQNRYFSNYRKNRTFNDVHYLKIVISRAIIDAINYVTNALKEASRLVALVFHLLILP